MPSNIRVNHGDSRDVLKTLADNSIDSCVTDPPYALVSIQKRFGKAGSAPAQEGRDGLYRRASAGFMGQQWDTGEVAFDPAFWGEVLRVLKPGAHLLAFSGTRTYHRMACSIEDAGFEIRDQIGWVYGSGFPKSHNQKGEWEGWGTALKPAWEPICMARKPLFGTVAQNLLHHATGALNIDGCRIATADELRAGAGIIPIRHDPGVPRGRENSSVVGKSYADSGSTSFTGRPGPIGGDPKGRWPANVIHDGSAEVIAAFPQAPGMQAAVKPNSGTGQKTNGVYGSFATDSDHQPRGDAGSAARFFYSAKADKSDRLGSKHPTVKPVDLMAYLCRLVTPLGGTVLDPFAGSGTTGMACMRDGFDAILIEREAQFVADIRRRIAHVDGTDGDLFSHPST